MGYANSGDLIRTLTQFDGSKVEAGAYRPVWIDSLADDVTLEAQR